MKFHQHKIITILSYVTVALCFNIVLPAKTDAQSSGSRPSSIDRRVEQITNQREQYERDTLRDGNGEKNRKTTGPKPSQATTLQVKQDFERIQSVYNEIVKALTANAELDYRFIANTTGEIKKCAGRLKKNLALPEPESNEKDLKSVSDIQEDLMKPSLQKLCHHIVKFVTNPLFESSGVLDIEQSTKASRDLRKILELSGDIERTANRLSVAKK